MSSAYPSPEQVIEEYLTQHGFFDAIPGSFQFGRSRILGRQRLYAATFDSARFPRSDFICYLVQDDAGVWRFSGGAGGMNGSAPQRGQPWINLGGSPGNELGGFYAGGRVMGDGGAVARVRLRTANGVVIEDTPDADSIALFLSDDPVQLPIAAELLDSAGQIIAQHALHWRSHSST
jgi:hypothetical protein